MRRTRCPKPSVWWITVGDCGGSGWCVCDDHKLNVMPTQNREGLSVSCMKLTPDSGVLLTYKAERENRKQCQWEFLMKEEQSSTSSKSTKPKPPEDAHMNNPAHKIGDVVRLKSGGPLMTVNAIDVSSHHVNCFWFSDGGEVRECRFSVEAVHAIRDCEPVK